MSEKDMRKALTKLAFEMTASMETANTCICDMELDGPEELYQVSNYLIKLLLKEENK